MIGAGAGAPRAIRGIPVAGQLSAPMFRLADHPTVGGRGRPREAAGETWPQPSEWKTRQTPNRPPTSVA